MYEARTALVVMYHYVHRSERPSHRGTRPLFVSEFEKQLDWLQENFSIVSGDEFLHGFDNAFRGNGKPLCLLTFDDGTRDHIEVVLPILQRRSLQAVFFVLTWPIKEHKMPVTHALHWVLGQDEESVWGDLQNFAKTRLGGVRTLGTPEEAMRTYGYETPLRALIKYAVNFELPAPAAEEWIAELILSKGKSLGELATEWFLTGTEVQSLYSHGMDIGIHGGSHRSVKQLGPKGIRDEIVHSSSHLRDLMGKAPAWFGAPFGGSDLVEDVLAIHQACREVNVKAIVTTQKRVVTPESNAYEIPRYDCVDLPPRGDQLARSARTSVKGRTSS